MKTRNWFVSVLMLICVLLSACATPATTAPTSAPAPATAQPAPTTQPDPTQPAPTATSVPSIPDGQVVISVDNETFNATVTGNGEIGIILANTSGMLDTSGWAPLVDALGSNEKLRIVTFIYRSEESTTAKDARAVFEYLKAQGVNKVICIVAGYGQACGSLQKEPEIAGMVFYVSAFIPVIEADFPKLFLAINADPFISIGEMQREYDQAAEPKVFKTYESGRSGMGVFTDPKVGSQVLADITDFINGIVNGQ